MHIQQPKYHKHGQTITENTRTENQIFKDLSEGMVRCATAETTCMATDNATARVVSEHTRRQYKIHAGQFRRGQRATHIQGL